MSDMLYLRLDGIEGEEPIGDSQGLIAIMDYSHALSVDMAPLRPSAGANATLRRSTCRHGLFSVTKGFDKTSTKIFSACSNCVVFKHAVVYACSSQINDLTKSSAPEPFLSIVMTDAIIAEFSYGFEGNWQVEHLSLRYSSIGWHVDWINPDTGDNEQLEPVGWDGALNKTEQIDIPSQLQWSSGSLL